MTAKKRNRILLTLYCLAMLVLLFWRERTELAESYLEKLRPLLIVTPFKTIRHYIGLLSHSDPVFVRIAVMNLFGNVLLFMPLGALLPMSFPRLKSLWRVLGASAAAVICVEICQMLTLLGRCDIDDLILNLLGTALGYGTYRLLNHKKSADA